MVKEASMGTKHGTLLFHKTYINVILFMNTITPHKILLKILNLTFFVFKITHYKISSFSINKLFRSHMGDQSDHPKEVCILRLHVNSE